MKKYTKSEVLLLIKKAHLKTMKELEDALIQTQQETKELGLESGTTDILITMQNLATTGLFLSNIKKMFEED